MRVGGGRHLCEGGAVGCGLGDRGFGVSRPASRGDRRLHRHIPVRPVGAHRCRAELVVTRPPAARGRGRRVAPTPLALGARELGLEVREPDRLEDLAGRAGRTRTGRDLPVRLRRPGPRAAPLRPRDTGRAPLAGAALARCRADRARADGGRRGHRCVDHPPRRRARRRAGLRDAAGRRRGGRRLRIAERAAGRGRGRAAGGRGRRPARVRRPGRGRHHLCREADRGRSPARPGAPAVELERTVRALRPHVGARLPGGLGVVRRRSRRTRSPRARLRTTTGASSTARAPERSSSSVVQPPGGRPMDAAAYLRGHAV